MAELDLIPQDYRTWLSQRSMIVRCATVFAVINVLGLLGGIALAHAASERKAAIVSLRAANAITQQQQTQLQQLSEQRGELERRWSLLRSLRAGAAVSDIFTLIDRAVVAGDLWFLDWSFRRAGIIVDGEQRGVETGYFVIVSDSDDAPGTRDLSVETHMTIHGQARDHQALSRFVRALFEQSDVRDVSVQKTSQTRYGAGFVVDFDITVVLNSAVRGS